MDWKSVAIAAAKKLGIIAIFVVIGILINPLADMKPYGQYVHAALSLFFVFYVYGRVIYENVTGVSQRAGSAVTQPPLPDVSARAAGWARRECGAKGTLLAPHYCVRAGQQKGNESHWRR